MKRFLLLVFFLLSVLSASADKTWRIDIVVHGDCRTFSGTKGGGAQIYMTINTVDQGYIPYSAPGDWALDGEQGGQGSGAGGSFFLGAGYLHSSVNGVDLLGYALDQGLSGPNWAVGPTKSWGFQADYYCDGVTNYQFSITNNTGTPKKYSLYSTTDPAFPKQDVTLQPGQSTQMSGNVGKDDNLTLSAGDTTPGTAQGEDHDKINNTFSLSTRQGSFTSTPANSYMNGKPTDATAYGDNGLLTFDPSLTGDQLTKDIGSALYSQLSEVIGDLNHIGNGLSDFESNMAGGLTIGNWPTNGLGGNGSGDGGTNLSKGGTNDAFGTNVWVMNWPEGYSNLFYTINSNLQFSMDTNFSGTNGVGTNFQYVVHASDSNGPAAVVAATLPLNDTVGQMDSLASSMSATLNQAVDAGSEPNMILAWGGWSFDFNPVHNFGWAFAFSRLFFTWIIVVHFLTKILDVLYQIIQNFAAAQTGGVPNMMGGGK